MSTFEIPDWAMPQAADAPPSPPPDPAVLREQQIADNTRAEQALNGFIAAKQAALFEAPDAFYRTEGADAIHAAPVILYTLSRLRDDSLDGLGNDAQRDRLGPALDAHLQLARDDIGRHVAEQSLAWQRQTAQDRIALLAKEAAYHHNDDELVDSLGHAAATAARAHARVGAGPPGGDAEDTAAATARSGVLGAAIQARLDRGDTEGASALFTQVQDQLDPEHAAPLQGQIEQAQVPPFLAHPEIVGPGTIEPEAAALGTDEAATPESAGDTHGPTGNAPSPAGPTSASTVALPVAGTISEAVATAAKAAARVAPYLGRAASGLGAAATVLLVPGNTQATTTELGKGIRIRSAPGQRTVTIERQVDNGILGTGIGARWEELPVQAEHATAPDGRSVIAIDPRQLESAIGAEAMGRIVPQGGVSMARPPRDGEDKQPPPGIGHNSKKVPDPDDENKPPPSIGTYSGNLSSGSGDPDEKRRENRRAANAIGKGHAYAKHVMEQVEFPDIHSPSEFSIYIEKILNNPTETKMLDGGRVAHWDGASGTVVIRNPRDKDGGTAFRPKDGRNFFDELE